MAYVNGNPLLDFFHRPLPRDNYLLFNVLWHHLRSFYQTPAKRCRFGGDLPDKKLVQIQKLPEASREHLVSAVSGKQVFWQNVSRLPACLLSYQRRPHHSPHHHGHNQRHSDALHSGFHCLREYLRLCRTPNFDNVLPTAALHRTNTAQAYAAGPQKKDDKR